MAKVIKNVQVKYVLEVWFADWAPLVYFKSWEEAMALTPRYRDRCSWPLRLALAE